MDKSEPYDYEQFFAGLLGGVRVNGAYDVMGQTILVEVKSCSARCRGGRTDRFGRFHIQLRNHVDLKLRSVADNKVPLYGFMVKMDDVRDMCIIRSWEHVESMLDYRRLHNYLQWYKVFGLPLAVTGQI